MHQIPPEDVTNVSLSNNHLDDVLVWLQVTFVKSPFQETTVH